MSFNSKQIINDISHAMQTEFNDSWAVSSSNIQEVLESEKENINELLQLHRDKELDFEELKSELEDVLVVVENKLLAKAIANKVTVKKAIDLVLNSLLGSASKLI